MVWTPKFNVTNARALAANLLAFFIANQSDALIWANGGPGLRPFQSIADSIATRTLPIFPALQFASDADSTDYTNDILDLDYQVVFDVMIENANPAAAVTEARVYAKALASLVREIPDATLIIGSGWLFDLAILISIGFTFDPIKTNDPQTDFLQIFHMKVIYEGVGSH